LRDIDPGTVDQWETKELLIDVNTMNSN